MNADKKIKKNISYLHVQKLKKLTHFRPALRTETYNKIRPHIMFKEWRNITFR